jgi:hypothetical protein
MRRWVRVKSGPLAGVEGFLVRKKSLFRLVISIKILSRSVSAEIDASLVERAVGPTRGGMSDRLVATVAPPRSGQVPDGRST